MNERLKYRIWDKKAKSYTNSIGYPGASFHCVSNYYLSPDGEIVDFVTTIGCNQDDATKGPVDQDDYIVEFNTGMKDKNGRPIYDGDVVEWGNLKYLVEWESNKWQARCPYHHRYHHPKLEHFRDVESGIVVGNIFENEELLK